MRRQASFIVNQQPVRMTWAWGARSPTPSSVLGSPSALSMSSPSTSSAPATVYTGADYLLILCLLCCDRYVGCALDRYRVWKHVAQQSPTNMHSWWLRTVQGGGGKGKEMESKKVQGLQTHTLAWSDHQQKHTVTSSDHCETCQSFNHLCYCLVAWTVAAVQAQLPH